VKTANDWWNVVEREWGDLQRIIFHHMDYFHPAYETPGDATSKPTGRKLLEEVEHLRKKRDRRLRAYLGVAWGVSSDAFARSWPGGWGMLCDLLSEDWVLDITFDLYIQLHEHVELHYYVDHYSAEFHVQDGNHCVAVGGGETIDEAMDTLLRVLGTKTLQEWRRTTECVGEGAWRAAHG